MSNYLQYVKAITEAYKSGITTFEMASGKIYGYLECLRDMGVITTRDTINYLRSAVEKLLEIKNTTQHF